MQKIIAVDWWEGRPHEVYTCGDGQYNSYDIDWDQDGQGYYHCSGFGGGPDKVGEPEGLPAGVVTIGDLIGHYDLIHATTVFCKICDGCMPEDAPCKHLYWDDDDGCWGGPGSTE